MTEVKCDLCKTNPALERHGHHIHLRALGALAMIDVRREDSETTQGETQLHQQDICRDCLLKLVGEG